METNIYLDNSLIAGLRSRSPLVYHLTNVVTVNDCANITLAIGGSPVMSTSPDEAAEMASFASALVVNMGTPDALLMDSMMRAGTVARQRGIPIIFDPVGAGATAYRRAFALRVMDELQPAVVKGNVAEIRFLAGQSASMRGVDSLDSEGGARACWELAKLRNCVAMATGAQDHVSDGVDVWTVSGGCRLLGQLCGTGCMTGSLAGSFAASGASPLQAALAASLSMKLAGERAAIHLGQNPADTVPGGPIGLGSFRVALHDAVCSLSDADFHANERISRVVL